MSTVRILHAGAETQGAASVEASGETVRDLLDDLMVRRLYAASGSTRRASSRAS